MRYAKLLLLFLAFVLASPAAAIFSENFEGATTLGFDGTYGVIAGTQFSLTAGSIDVNGPGSPGYYPELCTAPASGNCIDTTGGGTPTGVGTGPGTISTTSPIVFSTPGWYILSFDLEGWYDTVEGDITDDVATDRVDLGTLIVDDEFTVYGADNPYPAEEILFQVTAPNTSATLTFTSLGGNYSFAGGILDNISISDPAPVPEPTPLLLFGVGALIVLAKQRARQ